MLAFSLSAGLSIGEAKAVEPIEIGVILGLTGEAAAQDIDSQRDMLRILLRLQGI